MNTCVWERQDFRRWLFIISPSTVMATGDCRSTWNPAAITQEIMTPSKGPGAHIKDKGPAFPRGQEKPLYGNCSAFIIRLWTNPSVTWRNNAEKTGKSSYNGPQLLKIRLVLQRNTHLLAVAGLQETRATQPRGLREESFLGAASELPPTLCALSKNFHTQNPVPVTPQDSIKMIGKYRPSFLARQPKNTVPQGREWVDSDLH